MSGMYVYMISDPINFPMSHWAELADAESMQATIPDLNKAEEWKFYCSVCSVCLQYFVAVTNFLTWIIIDFND